MCSFILGFIIGAIVGIIALVDICCVVVSGKESKNEDRQRDANRGIYNK